MSVEEIYCAKCHNQTEETLLLSCDHNLCIHCAADSLSRQEPQGMISKSQVVTCELCNSQTEIDPATTKEILSIAMVSPSNLSPLQNYSQTNIYPNPSDSINLNQYNLHQSNSNLFIPIHREVCSEHGEPITYLCFDCLSKCICAECVVHGVHKNHEVINIKKAYPLISEKTEEILTNVEDKIKDLTYASTNIENKKLELSTMNEKCKRDIKVAFEEIRIKLNKREKEILDKTDAILRDNLNELNTYSRLLQSKIISMNKMVDTIQAHLMRKDELTLINFYCENKNKLVNNTLLQDLKCIPDLTSVSNVKMNIDQQSFDNLLSALNAFNFEVTSLKGIDVNSGINTQKYVMQRNLYGMNKPNNMNMNMNNTNSISYQTVGSGNMFNNKGNNMFDLYANKTN